MKASDAWTATRIREIFASSNPGDWGTDTNPESGIAVLRSTNFRNDGSIDYSDIAYRKVEKRRLAHRRVTKGAILIEKSGGSPSQPAGRVAYCDSGFNGTASNFIEIIRVENNFSSQFVAYLLYYLYQTGLVLKYQQQTTGIINFKLNEYVEEIVKCPSSKPEQTKIAEILSTVDRAIEQTEALIAKQQRIKTGLMQDLLTRGIDEHGNLRSEETHQFKDSPLGRVPKNWCVQSLGDALHKAKGFLQTGPFGSQLHADEYVQEGIPVIMPQDIFDGRVLDVMIVRIPKRRAEDLRKHRVGVNDIVFSRRGDLSRAAATGDREVGWLCGTGCFLLRVPSNAMNAHWLVDFYRHHLTQRQIETNAVGSTMPSLNNAVMENVTIAFPSLEEQQEITRRRNAVDRKIYAIRNNLLKLRSLKTALMQDLLTGKVRVTPLLTETQEAGA